MRGCRVMLVLAASAALAVPAARADAAASSGGIRTADSAGHLRPAAADRSYGACGVFFIDASGRIRGIRSATAGARAAAEEGSGARRER